MSADVLRALGATMDTQDLEVILRAWLKARGVERVLVLEEFDPDTGDLVESREIQP
ncbi:MAG: hypothetical protein U0791_23425 [Gemmataceae bacterium]